MLTGKEATPEVASQGAAQPPTRLTRLWVRALVGFMVGASVGLAPYLGLMNVPMFVPLLELLPRSVRSTAIPLSSALMGVIAMWVQWYGWDRTSPRWLKRSFVRGLVASLSLLILLMIIHTAVVVGVEVDGGGASESFIVSLRRTPACKCALETPDSACIKLISFEESEIQRCWGDRPVRFAKLSLGMAYLATTTSVGLLCGLVVLRDFKRGPTKQPKQPKARRRVTAA